MGDFNHAPRVRSDRPQQRKKKLQRPGDGRSGEELFFTTSPKPEETLTLGCVNIQSTKSEHATLFMVLGRLSAHRDDYTFAEQFCLVYKQLAES